MKFQQSLLDLELDAYTPLVVDSNRVISAKYETFKEAIQKGTYGKTAQYWHMYMDVMRFQHQIHIVVQENDFNQRLHAWEYFIPYYFATNKSNHARYILYPGLKSILEANCISRFKPKIDTLHEQPSTSVGRKPLITMQRPPVALKHLHQIVLPS